ncbi:nesprin-1-like, partial [Notothenia coriiceps]|uniref:Nesprin-1-like n=1 Tax=Notothenia coriiceps TaxID=8208 RepID=A0A6I9NA65_9TELE
VRERSLPLLRESQSLLPPLEEMERNISGFYQALEKASHITGTPSPEGGDFKIKCQELVTFTHSCKKCLTNIERNHQNIQKILSSSSTLEHLDLNLLQKRVADLQASSQVTCLYSGDLSILRYVNVQVTCLYSGDLSIL